MKTWNKLNSHWVESRRVQTHFFKVGPSDCFLHLDCNQWLFELLLPFGCSLIHPAHSSLTPDIKKASPPQTSPHLHKQCINPLSCCHVLGLVAVCVNKQLNYYCMKWPFNGWNETFTFESTVFKICCKKNLHTTLQWQQKRVTSGLKKWST